MTALTLLLCMGCKDPTAIKDAQLALAKSQIIGTWGFNQTINNRLTKNEWTFGNDDLTIKVIDSASNTTVQTLNYKYTMDNTYIKVTGDGINDAFSEMKYNIIGVNKEMELTGKDGKKLTFNKK